MAYFIPTFYYFLILQKTRTFTFFCGPHDSKLADMGFLKKAEDPDGATPLVTCSSRW